jgi:alkanesulfonate monooxygenase SsuD/methylene tetrahydromethanopterin reductase-like flavin-dependent oxidoreductase (luciferase family)
MTRLRSALWLPIFDDLADPAVVARLAAEAEEAGWHGVFVWDHLRRRAPVRQVADPWITLAAIATERLRFGPMVTPLARRRPPKVARETATLDRLSGGRLTLGVGLGSDRFADELCATGEELDDRRRGQMLDESLEILTAAWSVGRCTITAGTTPSTASPSFPDRFSVPACRCGPRDFPVTSTRCAAPPGTTVSSRSISNTPTSSPTSSPPSLVSASERRPDMTSASPSHPAPYANVGATWWLAEFAPETVSLDQVRGVLRDGPVEIGIERIR